MKGSVPGSRCCKNYQYKLQKPLRTYRLRRVLHSRDQVESQVREDRVDGVGDYGRRATHKKFKELKYTLLNTHLTPPSMFLAPALLAALAALWIEAMGRMVAIPRPICTGL